MNTNQHTDASLIKAYQSGDKHALALLVKRWHLQFCKKAHWIVKDADLSKDIAQESWRTIINKLHTLQNPSSFKSWALRIVYSKSLDALRLQSRKQKREKEFKDDYGVMVDIYDENTQLKAALLKAILSLSLEQQSVIKLFYIQEYSLKEISKTLDISVGTVKSRLYHAREKLKLILK